MELVHAGFLTHRPVSIFTSFPPPCRSMKPPVTPTKEPANDKLIKTIDQLSARWGLPLPRRDAQWSPSKSALEQSVEEKVVGRIKFLSFKGPTALDKALEAFERKAVLISQGWIFKPHADHDLLPRRSSTAAGSLPGSTFLRRSNADPRIVNELMKTLFEYVDQAADQVKRTQEQVANHDGSALGRFCFSFSANSQISNLVVAVPPGICPVPALKTTFALPHFSTDAKSQSFSGAFPAQLVEPQKKKRSLPYRHTKEEDGAPYTTLDDTPVSSSEDFNPDQDTLSILEDINMSDSPPLLPAIIPPLAANKFKSSDDEDFMTPLSSPTIADNLIDPLLRAKTGSDLSRLNFPQSDFTPLTLFSQSRKRSFPETVKPSLPRKASRGDTKTQPFTANKCLMDVASPRHPSTSFDSVGAATTTTTASSIAWSAPRSYASAFTTPNTSFRTDPLMTSFGSNQGSLFYPEILSEIPESKSTIRSAPNTPRAKRTSATLQRAATTSNAESQVGNAEPMDIDRSEHGRGQTVFSHLHENPNINQELPVDNLDFDLPQRIRSLPLLRT